MMGVPIKRRAVLKAAGLSGFCLFAQPTLPSFAKSKIKLGSKTIHSISDGFLQLPISMLFPDVELTELEPLLSQNGLDTKALSPECNLTMVEDGDRKILFDAGAGPNFMASAGQIFSSMDERGISPDTITDVIFTHGHPDHIWGILDDFDEISFPNARLHFPRVEWDFWRADDTLEKVDEARKSFVVGARNRMAFMEERVELFNVNDEVISGIEVIDTAGHTPGHCSFVVHEGTESLMVIGDAITNHVVSFERPDWPSGSDQDNQLGIKTRMMLLDRLATDKMRMIGYHLPNGGLGYVERKGREFEFIQG